MELVLRVHTEEAFAAALEVGVGGVTLLWPWAGRELGLPLVTKWRAAAARAGVKFYLEWPAWVAEAEFPQALKHLKQAAALEPELLSLADIGLMRAARRRHPGLQIQAGEGWGCHNSWGLRIAEELGLSRVTPVRALTLKDLALMRRVSSVPLHFHLSAETPGPRWFSRPSCGEGLPEADIIGAAAGGEVNPWLAALEKIPGLLQLGIEAATVGEVFAHPQQIRHLVPLLQQVLASPTDSRERLLGAAREVLATFGASNWENDLAQVNPTAPCPATHHGELPWKTPAGRYAAHRPGRRHLWLECRGYEELAALARRWPGQMLLPLTPANYQAILPKLAHWRRRRRLIFRLPLIMPEEHRLFYQQAVATLTEGGFTRFVAGNWGAVSLVREFAGDIYGDETLGVRNLAALQAARDLGVKKICLPSHQDVSAWHRLVHPTQPPAWWAYLWHVPIAAVYALKGGGGEQGQGLRLKRQGWRWVQEGNLAYLCPKAPVDRRSHRSILEKLGISPLVTALPHSGWPWGAVPPLAAKDHGKIVKTEPHPKLPD